MKLIQKNSTRKETGTWCFFCSRPQPYRVRMYLNPKPAFPCYGCVPLCPRRPSTPTHFRTLQEFRGQEGATYVNESSLSHHKSHQEVPLKALERGKPGGLASFVRAGWVWGVRHDTCGL